MANILSVSSGKGGVGKTLAVINLAYSLKRLGESVLVIDGDIGLANIDILLGLYPKMTISDVLDGHATIDQIIMTGPYGIKLLPSGSGIAHLQNLSLTERDFMLKELRKVIIQKYSFVIIDTGSGINPNVLLFNQLAETNIIVTTHEPHAMADAYAMIKVLTEHTENKRKNIQLIVNMTRSENEGLKVWRKLSELSEKFLNLSLINGGTVPFDPQIQQWVFSNKMAHCDTHHTVSGQAWYKIAQNLTQQPIKSARSFHGNIRLVKCLNV